jgi:hypothetical protein
MKRKYTSKCKTCSGQLSRKNHPRKPYGTTGTNPYCPSCDRDYTYSVSKSGVRQKAKKNIKKELDTK